MVSLNRRQWRKIYPMHMVASSELLKRRQSVLESRSKMYDVRPPLKIFLVGPAAAGKTTARKIVLNILSKQNLAPVDLSVESIHRMLCPPPSQPGHYHYDEYGALILERREQQVPEALRLLARECCRSGSKGFVAEFTHQATGAILRQYFAGSINGATVLHITASLSDRQRRNAERRHLKVPAEVVNNSTEVMCEDDRVNLTAAGAIVYSIRNGARQGVLEDVLASIMEQVLAQA